MSQEEVYQYWLKIKSKQYRRIDMLLFYGYIGTLFGLLFWMKYLVINVNIIFIVLIIAIFAYPHFFTDKILESIAGKEPKVSEFRDKKLY